MKQDYARLKGVLLASAAVAAVGAPTLALGQGKETKSDNLNEVVVTGIVRSNLSAVRSKLNATGISDVVSSDEVQALPDLTIVEALRRIPGLSVLPATDNEHPRDEAATPVLRGLGPVYNNVTIDGLPIASPGTPNGTLGTAGRGVRLDILPSSMIQEMVVKKTFSADLDPNAIGGAIELKTRSAFDHGGRSFFTIESSLGAANDEGAPKSQDPIGYRLVSTGSFTFGPDKCFGLVVAANYQKLDSATGNHATTDTIFESYYNNGTLVTGASTGNGIAVPQQDKYWLLEDHRTRYGLTAKFQARPVDKLETFLTLGTYRFQDNIQRNELILDPRVRTTVLNQTPTSGSYPVGDVEVGYQNDDVITNTKVAQFGADYRLDDHDLLRLRANASRATYREPFEMFKYVTGVVNAKPGTAGATVVASPNFAFNYNTSGFYQSFNFPAAAYYNLANYGADYWRPNSARSITDTLQTIRLDYAHNREARDRGLGFGLGVSYSKDSPTYEIHRPDYEPNTNLPQATLAAAIGPTGTLLPLSQTGLYMLTIDPAKARAAFEALLAAGGLNQTDQSTFNNQDNFEHREETVGAYGLVSYATDKFRFEAGLHSDNTDQRTVGRAKINGVWTPYPTSSSYKFLLPSAVGSYQITDALDVRFGASQTIGRPSYDAYAARSSISFVNVSDQGNGAATGVKVSVGNPAIKPRLSTNLDLAVDYRLTNKKGGLLSVAVFNKDIKDEIFTASSIGYTYQGVNYVNAVVSEPVNASKATVKGLELSAVVNSLEWVHPWLMDFGFAGNWAFLDGRINVLKSDGTRRAIDRLIGQPDQTKNVSVFYQAHNFEVRAAWNWQGKALRSVTNDIDWQDLYFAPREQVDVQASYHLKSNLSFVTQVSNLTHQRIVSVTGPGQAFLKDSYSVPTTYWAGVRWTY